MTSMQQIVDFSNRIAEHFDPDRIILFGSYAYGKPDDNSDVDLLIVMPFEGRRRKKAVEIWKKLRPTFSVDLMLRTPAEAERRYQEFDPLVREAFDRGRVLRERRLA